MLPICSEPLPSRKIKDIRGDKFGRLTVVGLSHISTNKGKNAYWNCICDCGNVTAVSSGSLRQGTSKSCGCLAKEVSRAAIKKTHLQGNDLYFIRVKEYIKVGRADNSEKRLSQIQAMCPYDCELLLVLKDRGSEEHSFHDKLKNYHHTGEWFKIDWTTLCEIVNLGDN